MTNQERAQLSGSLDRNSKLSWLAASLPLFVLCEHQRFFHDDAFISLRYCRSWIEGQGLVWNAGERVEGYTNFLHICLIRLGWLFGLDLPTSARLTGLLAFGALIILFARNLSTRLKTDWWGPSVFIPVSLTAAIPSLPLWSWSGLETMLFTSLVFAGVSTLSRQTTEQTPSAKSAVAAGVLLGLATLARPDGIAILGGSLAGLGLLIPGWPQKIRTALWLVFAYLAVIVPHLLWRHSYYGEWVPNTYYAKASGLPLYLLKSGVLYVVKSVGQNAPFILVAIFFFAAFRALLGREEKFLLLVSGLFTAYLVLVGGDHMPGGRMLAPAFPILGMSAALFWSKLRVQDANRARAFGYLAAGCALVAVALSPPRHMDPAAQVGSAVGRYIEANWPAGSLVCLATAGSTPYYAPNLYFIDSLGLNDKTIAHRKVSELHTSRQHWPGHMKGDGRYVLSRRPDFIVIGPAEGTSVESPWFLTDYELGKDPRFAAAYQRFTTQITVIEPGWFGRDRPYEKIFTYYHRRQRAGHDFAPK